MVTGTTLLKNRLMPSTLLIYERSGCNAFYASCVRGAFEQDEILGVGALVPLKIVCF